MTKTALLRLFVTLCSVSCFSVTYAHAVSVTETGTFAADDSLSTYNFTNPSPQTFDFYTTSYAGGMNANGTVSPGGGFVPVLTLFSSSGMPLGYGGGANICGGPVHAAAGTGLCNDAFFTETLAPGNYQLVLSEFPNVPVGNLSDGFLFAGDPTATGDTCGVPGGMFLEADVAPCVQRNANYAVNITSTPIVPEPSTLLLTITPMFGLAAPRVRRLLGL